jgi:gluconolactonase
MVYTKAHFDRSRTNKLTGGTNYKGQIIFAGEGQGDNIPSALYLMNPRSPHNTTSETQLGHRKL